jgi:hypothetical protein
MRSERVSLVSQVSNMSRSNQLMLVPDVYARKLDVLNRGLSGYNTDWAKPVFERVCYHAYFHSIPVSELICPP